MTLEDFLSGLGIFISSTAFIIFIFAFMFVIINVFFPFLDSLSPDNRLQRYIDEQCILGNKVAIQIRKEKSTFQTKYDATLIRSAIEGNEFAIEALKLERKNYGN